MALSLVSCETIGRMASTRTWVVGMSEQLFALQLRLHRELLEGNYDAFAHYFDANGVYEHEELLNGAVLWSNHVNAAYASQLFKRWLDGTHERQLPSWAAIEDYEHLAVVHGAAYCLTAAWKYQAVATESGLVVTRRAASSMWLNEDGKILWLKTSHSV